MKAYIIIVCTIFSNTLNLDASPALKAARVGGCHNVIDDKFIQCAAVEDECEEISGAHFKRADELEELGNFECSTEKLDLGSCEGTKQCAITKDSCADPNDFRSPSASNLSCNAEGRFLNGDFIPTQYGACKDGTTGEITCAITPAECLTKEVWLPASVVAKERLGGCRCSDIRIGVCKDSSMINVMLSTCAISADDCPPQVQTFGTARNAVDHALLDCRLCPNVGRPISDSNDSVDKLSPDQQAMVKKAEEDALSHGELAGIIIGGAFMFILMVFFLSYFNPREVKKESAADSCPTVTVGHVLT